MPLPLPSGVKMDRYAADFAYMDAVQIRRESCKTDPPQALAYMDAVQIRRESCKTDPPQAPDKPDKCPPRALFCWQKHVAGSQMQHLTGPAAQAPAHL